MSRINFAPKTKRIVAERAGLQCSYPTCNRRTLGPGAENDEISNSGTAAHIYSAAAGGPRGQGALTENELKNSDNAIWLCRDHGTLIDNNRGDGFSPQLLLSYKQMQEARIAHEHQGLYTPIGWIHKINLKESPIFESQSSFTLAKLNLIIGNNGTGKSALCEWIGGVFDISYLGRWRSVRLPLKVDLSYFIPQEIGLSLEVPENNKVLYKVNDRRSPSNPLMINIISPRKARGRLTEDEKNSDLEYFAGILNVDPVVIDNLIEEIHDYQHAKIQNITFENEDGIKHMYLDVDGTHPRLSFRALSGREQERVFVEFACALARSYGRYAPTVLIFDNFISIFFEGWFDYYSHHFLDPSNQFQTIVTIPSRDIDLSNVRWNGWQVLHTTGSPPECIVSEAS